jgi:integrase/recombinase XerD
MLFILSSVMIKLPVVRAGARSEERHMQKEISQFLEYLMAEKSPNTAAAYRNDLTQFLTFIRRFERQDDGQLQDWNDVDEHVVQEYLFYLKDREYAASTVARKIASVKSFFQFLQKRNQVEQDPSDGLDSPKVKKNLPHSIDPEQIDRLLAEPAKSDSPKAIRDKALLETLYATGMRVTELVNLNVDDVDLVNGTVTCGSGSKRRRTVPIYDKAVQALQRYLRTSRHHLLVDPDEPALFLNHRGRRLTRQGLWLIIKEYVQWVGIDSHVTPHTLRHSFATHLLNAGAGLKEVQERLGHASPTTTQVYRKISDQQAGELVIDGESVTSRLSVDAHDDPANPNGAAGVGPHKSGTDKAKTDKA